MNIDNIKNLLTDIDQQGLLGVNRYDDDIIDTVMYALDKGLLTRSETGNFILTRKGYAVLGINRPPESIAEDDSNFPPKYQPYGNNNSLKLTMSYAQQKKLKRNVSLAIIFLVILFITSLIWVYKFA